MPADTQQHIMQFIFCGGMVQVDSTVDFCSHFFEEIVGFVTYNVPFCLEWTNQLAKI